MKKATIVLFAILISNLIFGQKTSIENELEEPQKKFSFETENKNAQAVFVIDSKSYRIENLKDFEIDPNWIESVSVQNDEITRKIYGNKNGAILIYIKKEYSEKALKKIEKEKEKTVPNKGS